MFQYAIGRALSLRQSTELVLDTGAFSRYNLHNGYELSRIFNISARVANESDFRRVLGWRGYGRIRQALIRRRYSFTRGNRIIVETPHGSQAGISDLPGDCYLSGYWQSEKFFRSYQDQIRADFTFRLPLSPQNQAVYEEIHTCDAISLHVRRGDYVNNQNAVAIYANCPQEYYLKAIDMVASQCANPVLFIFSDDIEWVKEKLKFQLPCEYVFHNTGNESYNDMRLMSECKHNIIANSSFSWWAAWLNSSKDKIIVAPQKWFSTDQFSCRDLIPSEWIRL